MGWRLHWNYGNTSMVELYMRSYLSLVTVVLYVFSRYYLQLAWLWALEALNGSPVGTSTYDQLLWPRYPSVLFLVKGIDVKVLPYVGEIILGDIPLYEITYIYTHWIKWNKKNIKIRIRKQSAPQVKLKILQSNVVYIYSLFGPWHILNGYKKAREGVGTQSNLHPPTTSSKK